MKKKILTVTAIIVLLAALGIFLYPTVSQYINAIYAQSEISHYNDTVDTISEKEKADLLGQAEKYNLSLTQTVTDGFSSETVVADDEYLNILNITENGQIGTVNIPSIGCSLPVYHSGDDDMLVKGAVHLAGTAFPIGGKSTHSIISAHTAYPGKIFFDRLTDVEVGDEFSITVLGNTLYYKCIDINVVLPSDTSHLGVEKGRDLVTLVTCTPYSVNTHRLLVTGERIESTSLASATADEATPNSIQPNRFADVDTRPIVFAGFVIIIAVIVLIAGRKIKKNEKKNP